MHGQQNIMYVPFCFVKTIWIHLSMHEIMIFQAVLSCITIIIFLLSV
jgi:hypothetical protein